MLVFRPQVAKNILKVSQALGITVPLLRPFCPEESTCADVEAHRVSHLLCLAPEGHGETGAAHHGPGSKEEITMNKEEIRTNKFCVAPQHFFRGKSK